MSKVGFPLSKPQYEGDEGELRPVTWHTPLRERVSIRIYMTPGPCQVRMWSCWPSGIGGGGVGGWDGEAGPPLSFAHLCLLLPGQPPPHCPTPPSGLRGEAEAGRAGAALVSSGAAHCPPTTSSEARSQETLSRSKTKDRGSSSDGIGHTHTDVHTHRCTHALAQLCLH